MKRIAAAVALACACAVIGLHASDRTGIYAVVDKVVFEPNEQNPERVQIWGTFAVATRGDQDLYDPVQTGYLYFRAGTGRDVTRAEWSDLKSLAGTKRIAGFSSRFGQSLHVRNATEKPAAPDTYVTGIGVTTIRADRDYAPIRALAALISR
jgi:hypothetical protein